MTYRMREYTVLELEDPKGAVILDAKIRTYTDEMSDPVDAVLSFNMREAYVMCAREKDQ